VGFYLPCGGQKSHGEAEQMDAVLLGVMTTFTLIASQCKPKDSLPFAENIGH
jgi:hypothetical protein